VHALDEVRKHSAETERLGAMSGTAIAAEAEQMRRERDQAPPPPPRNKWTGRVPHPVLIGQAASLTPY
jgi:hypothetical protein